MTFCIQGIDSCYATNSSRPFHNCPHVELLTRTTDPPRDAMGTLDDAKRRTAIEALWRIATRRACGEPPLHDLGSRQTDAYPYAAQLAPSDLDAPTFLGSTLEQNEEAKPTTESHSNLQPLSQPHPRSVVLD